MSNNSSNNSNNESVASLKRKAGPTFLDLIVEKHRSILRSVWKIPRYFGIGAATDPNHPIRKTEPTLNSDPDYIFQLPKECLSAVMNLVSPKDLSRSPSLDGGSKCKKHKFGLDLTSGAKKMFLPKESLSIIDRRETANPRFWIVGTIESNDLSPATNYAAYLVFTTRSDDLHQYKQSYFEWFSTLEQGIDIISKVCEMSKSTGSIFLLSKECPNGAKEEFLMRDDGLGEIKLGDFNSSLEMDEEGKLPFIFIDEKCKLLKNELIVKGVEVRPRD